MSLLLSSSICSAVRTGWSVCVSCGVTTFSFVSSVDSSFTSPVCSVGAENISPCPSISLAIDMELARLKS